MKKKILLILACFWIIISLLLIGASYAKYISSIGTNASVGIDIWSVVINNTDILQNNNFSSQLSLQFPETEYHLENVIVPGAIGYFDLVIDTSEVSLPYKYSVTVVPDVTNEIADIRAIGFSTDGNNNQITYLDAQHTEIYNTVYPDSVSSSLRVYVEWFEESPATLNDAADTNIALDGDSAVIRANLTVEQIVTPSPTPVATGTETPTPTPTPEP